LHYLSLLGLSGSFAYKGFKFREDFLFFFDGLLHVLDDFFFVVDERLTCCDQLLWRHIRIGIRIHHCDFG
jgi:hypothetical protein